MTNPNVEQNHEMASESTPSGNYSIQMVCEILKRTNQLIQEGDLDRAQGELLHANQMAKEQYKKSLLKAIQNKIITPQTPLTPLPLAPMDAMMAVISSPKQTGNIPPQETVHPPKAPQENRKDSAKEQVNDRSIELQCYRDALAKAWNDGALTQDEERQLQELRTVLEILDAEHEVFEEETKRACYKNALAKHLSSSPAALSDTKSISELQKIFRISQGEHQHIQSLLVKKNEIKHRDKILIVDDDVPFLNMLATFMSEDGFEVTAVTTSDEAYTFILNQTPDLILCDVNLPNSTMNGFVLCEKIQANKNLQRIPFVFLTGLMDEKLACTGKELGADDYLLKPIARNALLSTLHGRLKRFRQLSGFSSPPTAAFY